MKTLNKFSQLLPFVLILFLFSCQKLNDEHAGHDHSGHDSVEKIAQRGVDLEHDDHNEHEYCDGHDEDHVEHDHEEDHPRIFINESGRKLAGIRTEQVNEIQIGKRIEIPGEVGFNEDSLAHITPRYPGVVREVNAHQGQYVEQGSELAVIESNESLSSYKVLAPISGHIISKHITLGEFKSEEENMFVIANLNSVWVDCVIYPDNMQFVQSGQKILIQQVGLDKSIEGHISYVAPIVDKNTRSAIVRTVLNNVSGEWRPGMFIKGIIETSTPERVPALLKKGVQVLDNKTIVFVPDGENYFIVQEVITGDSNDIYIELVSGIDLGTEYVTEGAFELKANIVTSSLGSHAGHGH